MKITNLIFSLNLIALTISCNLIGADKAKNKNSFDSYNKAVDVINKGSFDYRVKITDKSVGLDSVIRVRRYHGTDTSRLILTNPRFADQKCEDVIWNSKYVLGKSKRYIECGYDLLLEFKQKSDTNVVCNLYQIRKKDGDIFRSSSYLLNKYRIVAIGIGNTDPWMSTFDYDRVEENMLID